MSENVKTTVKVTTIYTRCYLKKQNKVYFYVCKLLPSETDVAVQVVSWLQEDDSYSKHISDHMRKITKEQDKGRLFHAGEALAPLLIPSELLFTGSVFTLR